MSDAAGPPTAAPIRRLVVRLTIGSFGIAALMGIAALLGGGPFGETEGRVLLTTLVVGCTSVAMLCYLATAGTRFQAVGVAGGVTVLVPAVLALLLIWNEDAFGEALGKAFGVGLTLAVTLAQLSLLLTLAGERRRTAWVLWSTVVLAVVLAGVISVVLVLEVEPGDLALRLIGVVAILDVLGTVVTLALALFGPRAPDDAGSDAGSTVRIPARLETALAEAARTSGSSREQVVAEALEAWLTR